MSAFWKRNGGWLLLGICMLALLILLPYIEKTEIKVDVEFRLILENRTDFNIDGMRLYWEIDGKSGVTDTLSYEDLVMTPLEPGKRLNIDFARKELQGVSFPSEFRSDCTVLNELNGKLMEIVVGGAIEIPVEESGEYLIVLSGTPGSYSIHSEEFPPED